MTIWKQLTQFVFDEEKCDNIPIGKSKIGGLPDLPPGVDYPVREAYTAKQNHLIKKEILIPELKLPMICQINCEELHDTCCENSLPNKGLLYMF